MNDLNKELAYLKNKVKEEINLSKGKKVTREERLLLEKSIMYRQERISHIMNILEGRTVDDLVLERKIASQYNNSEKSFNSRSTKSSSAGWNFKKA